MNLNGMNGGQAVAAPDAQAALNAVLKHAKAGLLGIGDDGRVLFCNPAAARILGVKEADATLTAPLADFLAQSPALNGADQAALADALSAPASQADEAPAAVTLHGGFAVDVAISRPCAGLRLASLAVSRAPGVPKERIDGLTGLSDREWFRERVRALLAGSKADSQAAVVMIDLDRFKAVNDMHGHPIGDALLQMVARRLRSAVRDADVASRLGGDEFAVATPAPAAAEGLAARLVDLLSRPYLIEGALVTVGASAGVAVGPRDGTDMPALIRAADLALYQAKEEGRQRVRVFEPEMDARARKRHGMLDDLRRAVALQQFELHYQPQTNLRSGRLLGFEALVRWRHPERGLVPPDEFIPLAEEVGLIVPIGDWVLRAACREAASWPGRLSVAVNVSAKQLTSGERLPQVVAAALAATGLAAERLEIEITESALVRYEKETLAALHAVRAMGVRVSMDDFGTGYSSLSQLRSFPFDKLKIDRSFIRDLSGSEEAVAVVRAIAALGTSLGMTTTAEGVETPAQEALIRADGCTDMQGYLVSRPVPAAEIVGLIDRLTASLEIV